MQLEYENDEEILADRALFPHKNDVKYLYKKYHKKHIGAQNRSSQDNSEQPFILVVITNLMKHCYELQETGKLVYIDTTAELDVLNTPFMILSISTSAGSLPLAIILISDETVITFTKALNGKKSGTSQYLDKYTDSLIALITAFDKNNRKFQAKCIQIAKDILNKKPIIEYRPSFLNRMELDAFFQKYQIALEVQGSQHRLHSTSWYKDIKRFKDIVDHDQKKRCLCQLNGIYLIEARLWIRQALPGGILSSNAVLAGNGIYVKEECGTIHHNTHISTSCNALNNNEFQVTISVRDAF
ncbi:6666_t:CDS:2 [Cetraspora pellucida]|uniref:6666_t:CDS:1 n=1 Tax=Cetraspora pellucida TaxID=1433469 RepID=A0A9N9EPW3_9GLOM|nr:6666_t:CDS:2 [Cetraspora pellucida]